MPLPAHSQQDTGFESSYKHKIICLGFWEYVRTLACDPHFPMRDNVHIHNKSVNKPVGISRTPKYQYRLWGNAVLLNYSEYTNYRKPCRNIRVQVCRAGSRPDLLHLHRRGCCCCCMTGPLSYSRPAHLHSAGRQSCLNKIEGKSAPRQILIC